MSVRKASNGKWDIHISNGRKGKRIRKRMPFKTMLEALEYEKQLKLTIEGMNTDKIDFDHEIFTEALEYYKGNLNKTAYTEMSKVADNFLKLLSKHGYLPIFALALPPSIITNYTEERSKISAPSTVNRELLLFRKMHDYWVSKQYCTPLPYDLTIFYLRDKKNHTGFSEHFFEQIIELHPEVFLGEKLTYHKPPSTKGYIPDSLFTDKDNNYVVVEIQKERLDRVHAYKILEYRDKLEEKLKIENIRMMEVIIGDSIPADRDIFLKKYGVELKMLPIKDIESKIIDLLNR